MEAQLIADARAEGAPHLGREQAAALLGADLAQLDAQLRRGAPTADGNTRGGLRVDQATAAFFVLTSPRRAELIVGPAGTGKTYTAVRMADAWRAAGRGQVVGIATTSAGRNVLLDAGIPLAENTAQFLGHLPGQREARGAANLGPDALVILDEASTTSMPDLAAIVRHAARSGAKRSSPATTPSSTPFRPAAGWRCWPASSVTPSSLRRCGSAAPGRAPPPSGSVPGTCPRSASTTPTAGCTAAATRR
jgi:AAA domain